MTESQTGWRWLEGADDDEADADARLLAVSFARCFAGAEGARALAHLRAMTVERSLGPDATEAALRHLEGQRQLVAYLAALIRRGRGTA